MLWREGVYAKPSGYTANVRRFLAALLLTVFVSLTAADPLVCADGCTNGSPDSHPGACLSCQNGMASPELLHPVSAPIAIVSDALTVAFRLTTPPSYAIEHPPRLNA